MKVNKKYILHTSILLAFTTPILLGTLTSCDQTWAATTPLICGSSDFNDQCDPFINFRNNNQLTDKDGQPLLEYLPSNFAFLKNKDNKSTSFYAYTSPAKDWIDENEQKKSWKNYDTNSLGWYQLKENSNDNGFEINFSTKDGNKKWLNHHNLEITKSASIVGSIAQSLNLMVDSALSYQQSFIDKTNSEKIANAWGCNSQDFVIGLEDFYEFLFANSNFHVAGKSNAFFKTTAVNFNFANDYLPFATYTNNQFTNDFKKILEGSNANFESFSFNKLNENNAHYTSKTTIEQEKFIDNKGKEYANVKKTTYQYHNVPIIINPISLVKTYLDPTRSSSFLITDFYQNDNSAIKNAIGNSWQAAGINNFIKTSSNIIGPTHKSFKLKMNVENPYKLQLSSNNVDKRLPNTINSFCFIALLNCKIDEFLDQKQEIIEHTCESSLVNIFPSYFLKVYKDDLFKPISNSNKNNNYIINDTSVNKHLEALANLHNRKSEDGQKINPKEVNDQSLLSFLKYLFAQSDGKVLTKDFIQPFEKM